MLTLPLVLLQAEKPSATVKLDAPSVAVGKPLKGVLTLTLPDGLHGYQNPPAGEYEIPIKLSVADAGIKLTKTEYPKGESLTVGGGDKPTLVYEGTIKIPFTLLAAKPGAKGVTLKVDYQLCNANSCFPPSSITAKVPLKVTPKAAH